MIQGFFVSVFNNYHLKICPTHFLFFPITQNIVGVSGFYFWVLFVGITNQFGQGTLAANGSYTLQELKLQGTKIRDGVVLSQYSRNKWFANDLSIYLYLYIYIFIYNSPGGSIAQS